jgi:hypothetical protein
MHQTDTSRRRVELAQIMRRWESSLLACKFIETYADTQIDRQNSFV